jgi:hypothetical protein
MGASSAAVSCCAIASLFWRLFLIFLIFLISWYSWTSWYSRTSWSLDTLEFLDLKLLILLILLISWYCWTLYILGLLDLEFWARVSYLCAKKLKFCSSVLRACRSSLRSAQLERQLSLQKYSFNQRTAWFNAFSQLYRSCSRRRCGAIFVCSHRAVERAASSTRLHSTTRLVVSSSCTRILVRKLFMMHFSWCNFSSLQWKKYAGLERREHTDLVEFLS